jgi:hypothetical protein
VAAVLLAVLGAVMLAAPLVPQFSRKMQPGISGPAREAAYILGVLLLISGVVTAIFRRRDVRIIALSLPMLAIPLVAMPVMDALGELRSTKSLASELHRYVSPHVHVVGVKAFTGSMAFYLRQPIVIASDDGEELTSNYVIRHYGQFSAAPASPLKPTWWLRQTIDGCCAMRLYIVRSNDAPSRALFESRGLRPVASGGRYVAYGPRVGGVNRIEGLRR